MTVTALASDGGFFERARAVNSRVGKSWGYVILDGLKLEVVEFGPRGVPGLNDGRLVVWKVHRVPFGGHGPFAYADSGAAESAGEAWRQACIRADEEAL